ncbi:hypothetical protein C5167_009617 [Papaver somniferum]|uniref:Uncharacterized protein n=1 Tax=Papaver somniferum TaxID=3469 RepID=A0A4Y7JZD2_PAPSO|nr:hypothetical protein C5167_009617 [Papaver somniferum]
MLLKITEIQGRGRSLVSTQPLKAAADEDANEADNDFPHAYFFVKYVCDRDNCGEPSQDGSPSDVLECNVCGRLRKEEDDMDGDNENDEDGEMLEG